MYKFTIYKTSYFGFTPEKLEIYETENVKNGLKRLNKKLNNYIKSGTVNDYTSFAVGELEARNKKYFIWFDIAGKVKMELLK